jgi:3-hydroxyisobutyrate dehydrogenase-like beta-hydroxyacid dehydrogenase
VHFVPRKLFEGRHDHLYLTQLRCSLQRNFDRITTDAFECTADRPGTTVINGIKDLSHIVRLGQSSGVPLATSETMLRHLQGLKEDGKEGLDWSAVALGVRKESK